MTHSTRIAVVGGGIYGGQMLKCFSAEARRGFIDLVAVADVNPHTLDRRAAEFNIKGYGEYEEMLDTEAPSAIAVATPDHLHAPVVLAAAERGIHVISQKPLDQKTENARAMIDACDRNDVLLFVDFHKRYDPAHIRLKQDIKAGRFGRLQYGHVHMEDRIEVPSVWLKDWSAKSSPSWFIGVHFYDLVYWLLDSMPTRILATGHKGKLSSMGIDTWDSVQSRVEFENGACVTFDISWILPQSFPSVVNQGLRLVGENGVAEVDSQDRGMLVSYSDATVNEVVNPYGALEEEDPIRGRRTTGYTFDSMRHFVDVLAALNQGATVPELKLHYPNGEQALVSTRIGEAIDDSLESGEFVVF